MKAVRSGFNLLAINLLVGKPADASPVEYEVKFFHVHNGS